MELDSDEGLESASQDLDEDDEDDGSDEAFKKAFANLAPKAKENLARSIRSHELFHVFEADQVGSTEYHAGKSEFGSVDDILRWNSWLDTHGDSWLRTNFCAQCLS